MEETLLTYGPAVMIAALALILRRRQATKKANELRMLQGSFRVPLSAPQIAVKSSGEKTWGRQILETFWEEDR